MSIAEIKIDPEFQKLIPPLSLEEREQLEKNILCDGCRDPLVLWNGILLDGHNRLEICKAHDIPFKIVDAPEEIKERTDARIWIRNNQAGRRNLTPAWKIELELGNKEDLLKKNEEIKAQTIPKKGQQGFQRVVSQNDNTRTRTTIAKSAGVSTGQVGMAEQVRKKAPELWEQAKAGEVSISTAYKQTKKKESKDKLVDSQKKIAKQTSESPNPPIVEVASYEEWLERQPLCDLLLTDPPYATDVEDITLFAKEWLPVALSKVKPTGRAFIFIGAYPQEIQAYLNVNIPCQILVWTYRNTIGPSPKYDYKLNWQAVLYYRMPDAASLDCEIMTEQFSVQDINAPDGRLGDRYHAWQKPMEIAERFVRHSTKLGDLVLDPFCCTGTFILAANKLGRVGKGCDIDQSHIAIAIKRGCVRYE
jgi:hypothetical protein